MDCPLYRLLAGTAIIWLGVALHPLRAERIESTEKVDVITKPTLGDCADRPDEPTGLPVDCPLYPKPIDAQKPILPILNKDYPEEYYTFCLPKPPVISTPRPATTPTPTHAPEPSSLLLLGLGALALGWTCRTRLRRKCSE